MSIFKEFNPSKKQNRRVSITSSRDALNEY